LDNNPDTTFSYNFTDLYPGMLKMLYTAILAIVMGIVVMNGWKM
jgi:hypothetical protein